MCTDEIQNKNCNKIDLTRTSNSQPKNSHSLNFFAEKSRTDLILFPVSSKSFDHALEILEFQTENKMSVESSTLESEIAASSGSPVKKVVKPETDVKQPASNGDGKENGKTESPTKKDEG